MFVNGNLAVRGSIMNSTIGSNSSVIVGTGRSKGGAIIGGELTAHCDVEASTLGSQAFIKTIIRVGLAQEERRELNNLKNDLVTKKHELKQLGQLENHYQLHPSTVGEEIMRKITNTRKTLLEEVSIIKEKYDVLNKRINKSENAKVVAHKRIYPGVTIYINELHYNVVRELGPGTFSIDGGHITFTPWY